MVPAEQSDASKPPAHTMKRLHGALRSYIPPQVSSVASSLRCCVATASSHATQTVHSYLLTFPLYKSLFTRIRALPIIEFYVYMWRVDPILFANTMFANYGLPVLMEGRSQLSSTVPRSDGDGTVRMVAQLKLVFRSSQLSLLVVPCLSCSRWAAAMPWYLSRRKISKLLRESRNSISHRLVANEHFSDSAIASFVALSIVYALVQTMEQVLRSAESAQGNSALFSRPSTCAA